MDLQEFPNEFSLRYHVHLLCVHVESVLKFAEDIAEEGPDNLSEEDKVIFDVLTTYLDRACSQANRVRRRARS